MSLWPDRVSDMIETVKEIELANRLLDGEALTEMPEGYAPLADLVAAARAEATPAELRHEQEVVAAMAEAIAESQVTGRSRVLRLVGAKAAVVAVLALTATGAAAATNNLPGPAQAAISNAASFFGLDVPSGDDSPAANSPNSDAGKPTEQPGTSAGDEGPDGRPDCAGNPSSDDPGCKGGVADEQSPNSNANSNATDRSPGPDNAPDDTGSGTPGGPEDKGKP